MNSVNLIGRLTSEPQLRYIPSTNTPTTRMIIAVNRNLSKEKKEEAQSKGHPTADFIPVTVWGKQAENAAKYLEKGNRVAIKGRITTGSYKTNEGETRYTTEVTAENIEFLMEKKKDTTDHDTGDYELGDFQSGSPQLDDGEVHF
ncbi:MAG: single-stranded DNA-binding protein [Acidaminobacter sp.]|nr:single-stranded DNA-binding protein [Acidaminobacter sp.]